MEISIEKAKDLSTKVLKRYGYTGDEAETISNSLIWAQKRGS